MSRIFHIIYGFSLLWITALVKLVKDSRQAESLFGAVNVIAPATTAANVCDQLGGLPSAF